MMKNIFALNSKLKTAMGLALFSYVLFGFGVSLWFLVARTPDQAKVFSIVLLSASFVIFMWSLLIGTKIEAKGFRFICWATLLPAVALFMQLNRYELWSALPYDREGIEPYFISGRFWLWIKYSPIFGLFFWASVMGLLKAAWPGCCQNRLIGIYYGCPFLLVCLVHLFRSKGVLVYGFFSWIVLSFFLTVWLLKRELSLGSCAPLAFNIFFGIMGYCYVENYFQVFGD